MADISLHLKRLINELYGIERRVLYRVALPSAINHTVAINLNIQQSGMRVERVERERKVLKTRGKRR